jgi:hypothetical protein
VSEDLALVDTDALVTELRRRSGPFFLIARPLSNENYRWRMHWGVDGGKTDSPEALARVLGLIEIGKASLLSGESSQDPDIDVPES